MSVRRKKRLPIIVPVASMADIAFLLIIFFMLTSQMIQEAHVKLAQASSADIQPMEQTTVTVSLDENGDLWVQGRPCDVGALRSEIESILAARDDRLVLVKIDKSQPQRKYGPIVRALTEAGAKLGLVGTKEGQ